MLSSPEPELSLYLTRCQPHCQHLIRKQEDGDKWRCLFHTSAVIIDLLNAAFLTFYLLWWTKDWMHLQYKTLKEKKPNQLGVQEISPLPFWRKSLDQKELENCGKLRLEETLQIHLIHLCLLGQEKHILNVWEIPMLKMYG